MKVQAHPYTISIQGYNRDDFIRFNNVTNTRHQFTLHLPNKQKNIDACKKTIKPIKNWLTFQYDQSKECLMDKEREWGNANIKMISDDLCGRLKLQKQTLVRSSMTTSQLLGGVICKTTCDWLPPPSKTTWWFLW